MPPVNQVMKQNPLPTPKAMISQSPTGQTNLVSAWDLVDTIRMLLYGVSGSGKTTFWATFPGPILALICSGGNKPGELRSINTPEYRKKIKPVIINTVEDYRNGLELGKEFATVVLDHASGMSDIILKEVLGITTLPVQKSWGLATQQQYGILAFQCKELFRALLNLPGNVVIVAQERVFGGEDTGDVISPTVGAALTPSVTGWLNPACDYVVQMFKKQKMVQVKSNINGKEIVSEKEGRGVEYCMRTEPHTVYSTKFRVPRGYKLPEYITDPTYDKVLSIINGKS